MHVQLRPRHERRGDEEGRRGGEVPGHLQLAERESFRPCDRHARRPDGDGRARRGEHPLGVVPRGRGLDDRRLAVGVEPGEQHRGLHLGARDRQGVVDRVERPAFDRERKVTVGRLDPCPHPAERLGDPRHRPARERPVAREREGALLPGEDPGEQPDERAGVRAVDRPRRGGEPREPLPAHEERVRTVLLDLDPEGAYRGDRRLGVRGAPETRDAGLVVADRPEQDRAVGDRLVPRDGDVPDEPRDGLDLEGAHSSSTGAATTP